MMIDDYLLYIQSLWWLKFESGIVRPNDDLTHHTFLEFVKHLADSGYYDYRKDRAA
jgi:hypothetical protein